MDGKRTVFQLLLTYEVLVWKIGELTQHLVSNLPQVPGGEYLFVVYLESHSIYKSYRNC